MSVTDTEGREGLHTARAHDLLRGRAQGMADILHRTNLLLGSKSDAVTTVLDAARAPAPAWTDGKTIWINGSSSNKHVHAALKDGWTNDSALTVTALNYHELAHVMFTPRVKGDLARRVRSHGAWQAFNILEDQRAESLFVGLYRPAADYFTRLVAKYLRDTKQQVQGNYALVAGRKFLPVEVRAFFRGAYRDVGMLDDIDRITSEYIGLEFPTDHDRAFDLIIEFHRLLTSASVPPASQGDHSGIDSGDHEGVRKQRRAAKRLDEQGEDVTDEDVERVFGDAEDEDDTDVDDAGGDEDDDIETDDAAAGGDGEEAGDEDDIDGSSSGGGSGEDAGDDEGDSDAADDGGEDTEGTDDSSSGKGSGAGGGGVPDDEPADDDEADEPATNDRDDLDERLDDLLDDIEEEADDRIKDEVESRRESFNDALGTVETEFGYGQYQYVPTPPAYARASRQMEREWKRIKDSTDPDWEYPVRRGQRLDTRRAMRAERTGDQRIFRKWQDGARDVNDFEAVLLLDTSSSMRGYGYNWQDSPVGKASAAVWATHRALRKVGADVTAKTFGDKTKDLINRGEKPDARGIKLAEATGWTSVSPAFRAALATLNTSRRTQRFVMIVTDGQFTDDAEFERILNDECDHDVVLVGIGGGATVKQYADHPRVVSVQQISDAGELVDATKDIVATLSKRWADTHGGRR